MKTSLLWIAALCGIVLGSGCSKPEESPAPAAPAAGQATPAPAEGPAVQQPGAPAGGGQGGSPMGRGMAAPPKPKDDAPLAPTPNEDAAVEAAEKSGDKAAISKAYLDRAVRHRIDDKAGDKVKYPAVLADLKKSLEADPGNERAKKVLEYVESLTKSGRDAAGGGKKAN